MNNSSFKPFKGSLTCISGASSGFGYATALKLAEGGSDLLVIARRGDLLEKLKQTCEKEYFVKVHVLVNDLSHYSLTQQNLENLPDEFSSPNILINNAGFVIGLDTLAEVSHHIWDQMIDVNIKAVLQLIRFFLPKMLVKKKGHIVNVGSISSYHTYKGGGVYCATKHALRAINETLRIELVDSPIRSSMISPGLAETEFSEVRFSGNKEKAKEIYKGIEPLNADDIAEGIYFILTRPEHVNISDLIMYPKQQALPNIVSRQP